MKTHFGSSGERNLERNSIEKPRNSRQLLIRNDIPKLITDAGSASETSNSLQ